MDRVRHLEHQEHLLRSLVATWHEVTVDGADPAPLRERISAELAETQMILERHLAEQPAHERAVESYRLEFELPTFHYLKRWYHLFIPESLATGSRDVTLS